MFFCDVLARSWSDKILEKEGIQTFIIILVRFPPKPYTIIEFLLYLVSYHIIAVRIISMEELVQKDPGRSNLPPSSTLEI